MSNFMLDHALKYLSIGWQPTPIHYGVDGVCSCHRGDQCFTRGKHPVLPNWQKTILDAKEVTRIWTEQPHFNVGLVTGARTNLLAVDIDAKSGGYESLRDLEEKHGLLPETVIASTGGGGRHYLFEYPKDIFIPNKGNLRPGLDIRGEGGQIVAAPSYHEQGRRRYAWIAGRTPSDLKPAEIPDWLIDLLHEQETLWVSSTQANEDVAEVYHGGSRNNNLFRLGCRLRVIKDLGPDELGAILHSLNQSKCRPPMDEAEVDLIVGSVIRKEARQTIIAKKDSGEAPPLIRVMPTTSIWGVEEEPIPYLVPNLLSEGEVCLLASPTEAGKSLIAMSLSLSIVGGLPAWNRGAPCKKGRVMYCTEELAGRTIRRRFHKLAIGMGLGPDVVNDANLCIIPQQNLSLALKNPKSIDALLLKAQEFRPDLVVLDTFVSYFGAPERDSDANRAWFGAVPIALRSAHNCAVVVQHHTRKMSRGEDGELIRYTHLSDDELNNEIRGTSDLAGVAERIWFIWKKSEERNDFGPKVCINFRNTKAREGDKHDPMQLVITDPDHDRITIECVIGAKSKKQKEVETKLRLVLPLGEAVKKAELVSRLVAMGMSPTAAYNWIATFVDQRILLVDKAKDYSVNPSQLDVAF